MLPSAVPSWVISVLPLPTRPALFRSNDDFPAEHGLVGFPLSFISALVPVENLWRSVARVIYITSALFVTHPAV